MNLTLPAWAELLPDEDFRFQFRIKPGEAAAFFAPASPPTRLCEERQQWLNRDPSAYAALLPEGAPLLAETLGLARSWGTLPASAPDRPQSNIPPGTGDPLQDCRNLGRCWEPDFLLLRPDDTRTFRLVAACVCFPSSWRLADKLGLALTDIHAAVPGLNPVVGRSIHQFLDRLRPGPAWLRSNWGLSRSPELNQHPDRGLPRLEPPLTRDEVWLRVEHQALVALPETGGVLFGIRVEVIPLSDVISHGPAVRGLIRALRTMPEDMAAYKNLAAVRAHVIEMLPRP